MTTDDLRTRAREAADKWQDDQGLSYDIPSRSHFIVGYLAHAAQQPSREQVAEALALTDDYDGCFERIGTDEECSFDREDCEWWLARADAVLALFDGADR